MNAPAKLAAYALVLTIAMGGGAAVGAAVGPIDVGGDNDGEPGHQMEPEPDTDPATDPSDTADTADTADSIDTTGTTDATGTTDTTAEPGRHDHVEGG